MNAALTGLLVSFSLIVAIGAQNAFVLRAGLRRQQPLVVALVSSLGDVVLISLGVLGLGTLLASNDVLRAVATWGGAAFLVWFGARSLRSALRGGALSVAGGSPALTARSAAMTALGFSLFNPHAYLDAVVLLGSVSARYEGVERAWFAVGACAASCAWFFALAFGSARLEPLFRSETSWRVLDVVIALTVFALAASLVVSA